MVQDTQFYPSEEQIQAGSGDDCLWVGNTYGLGALLSAVSAGVTVSAVILYHLGIIFGVFLPCKPVKKSFGIADRVRGSPLVLYGFGYIWGRFLSLLFLLFHRLAFPA